MDKHEFGSRLRHLRHERGETLEQMSEATGLSVAMLSRIETGQRHPSPDSVEVLAKHFGLPVEELMSVTIANRMVDRYGPESSWWAAERMRSTPEPEPRRYGAFSEMPIAAAFGPSEGARTAARSRPPGGQAAGAPAAMPHRDLWVADEGPPDAGRAGTGAGDLSALTDAARVAEVALESAMAAVRRAQASGDSRQIAEAERVLERLKRVLG